MGSDKRQFIHEDFLIHNEAGRRLYHEYAESLPIVDYHCHLPVEQLARDHRFENLTQIWLSGDHYKWRAMRMAGVDERYCTGDASDWEKFQKWSETVPRTIRNPLYHWTHMELKRPFGIKNRLLSPHTAKGIWEECNSKLAQPEFTCRGIVKQMNVEVICTTDDPCDSLDWHQVLQKDSSFSIQVLPAFRPDKSMALESPEEFNIWVDRLEAATDISIRNYSSYLDALQRRHDYFHIHGCRLSDHGIETAYSEDYTTSEVEALFLKIRSGKSLNPHEQILLKSALLYEFGLMDAEKGWVQQYHLGALRNVNSRRRRQLGADSGFDAIGDFELARPLARLLDRLDSKDRLPKTIVYNLNPCDNELLAAMIGCFQDGVTPGKIQLGSAWWFLDQKNGIERHLEALSNLGLLSLFIGMLTDSRSFLSYTRHEYFRRILCNLLGNDMEQGLIPDDLDLVGEMVRGICHDNAVKYFGFDLK